jgi:hypothetical protein
MKTTMIEFHTFSIKSNIKVCIFDFMKKVLFFFNKFHEKVLIEREIVM